MKNIEEYTKRIDKAVNYLKENKIDDIDNVIVLGSGLSDFTKSVELDYSIAYSDIPGIPQPTIEGHKGILRIGKLSDKKIAICQGRVHLYEGYESEDVTFLLRVLKKSGMKNVILTNAAGIINSNYNPGDFLLINDHINLTGENPLIGKNLDDFGIRFPDMSEIYDKTYIDKIWAKLNLKHDDKESYEEYSIYKSKIREGIYIGLTGPSYETPAEIKAFSKMGADVVGMSTVLEAIACKHMDIRIIGISLLSNYAAGLSKDAITHEEVQKEAAKNQDLFNNFIKFIFNEIYE